MDKTDFLEVNPPLGSIIVLSGNYTLIEPIFAEDGNLAEVNFEFANGKGGYKCIGDNAKRVAVLLYKRFGLHIKVSPNLEGVREVTSSLKEQK